MHNNQLYKLLFCPETIKIVRGMTMGKVAIIGGSGVKDSPAFEGLEWKVCETGVLNGVGDGVVEYQEGNGVIFIPRHGLGKSDDHPIDRRYGPSVTQYGANLVAARMLGANVVVATSAVGSLQKHIAVESLVIPDDYIDESGRNDNLFGVGIVVHANPLPAFSPALREILIEEARANPAYFSAVHDAGTYVVIPGDRFGTKAEGKVRAGYADIVGMTICPEASMAMQLGLHYAVAAFPVDVNLDANHEGGTLEVMHRLSAPNRVPAYVTAVIERAKEFAETAGQIPNLRGNIIPGDTARITNPNLRRIADELISTYCA